MTLIDEVKGVRLQVNQAAADAAIESLVGLPEPQQKALTEGLVEARDNAEMRADLIDIAFQIAARVATKGFAGVLS